MLTPRFGSGRGSFALCDAAIKDYTSDLVKHRRTERLAGSILLSDHRGALPAVRDFGRVKTWLVTGFTVRPIDGVRHPLVCHSQGEVTIP